jgi:hypothetical protein
MEPAADTGKQAPPAHVSFSQHEGSGAPLYIGSRAQRQTSSRSHFDLENPSNPPPLSHMRTMSSMVSDSSSNRASGARVMRSITRVGRDGELLLISKNEAKREIQAYARTCWEQSRDPRMPVSRGVWDGTAFRAVRVHHDRSIDPRPLFGLVRTFL